MRIRRRNEEELDINDVNIEEKESIAESDDVDYHKRMSHHE